MKIAIFTWCYRNNSINYGQMLQSYALQKVCNNLGHETQIIRYRRPDANEDFIYKLSQNERIAYEDEKKFDKIPMYGKGTIEKCCEFLNEHIDLSPQYYSSNEIEDTIDKFDIFLVGSDQLWNPLWIDDVNILNFNHFEKRCISYATGGITSDRSQNERKAIEYLVKSIDTFDKISVREPISKEILKKYTNKEIVDVLDPTLLLDTKEWDEVCSERVIDENYVFVMYMGLILPHRHLFNEVKRIHNSDKIIYLNMNRLAECINISSYMELCDSAGPQEFLSLIKHADAVCTDSFHAFVFSVMFNVPFYLMDRAYISQDKTSNLRWDNIINKFGINYRYANSKKEIHSIQQIDYGNVNSRLHESRMECAKWLKTAIEN